MIECSIFLAARHTENAWQEADRLADLVVERLTSSRITMKYRGDESHPDDHAGHRTLYRYSIEGLSRRARHPAELCLYLDLARAGEKTDWPWGERAILLVAFGPDSDDGWNVEHLAFGTDGRISREEHRRYFSPSPCGRLLEWEAQANAEMGWAQRPWAFGVELKYLSGPEQVEKQVIQPLLALLKNAPAQTAFESNEIVIWPAQN